MTSGPGEVLVAVRHGGVCGSDLHYWRRGGVGDFRLREPMVLGHEAVGTVVSYGAGATGPAPGTAVAVHPATPCGRCPECAGGPALRRAALAEPLSVALHAVRRAGDVSGRHVLVTGAGPIGCLVVAAAKAAGAARVTVTDLVPQALGYAAVADADALVRADDPGDAGWPGEVDVAVEASGAAAGLDTCLRRVGRGGAVMQLGMPPPGQSPLAGNLLVSREIELRGAFRFDAEFDEALELPAARGEFDGVRGATAGAPASPTPRSPPPSATPASPPDPPGPCRCGRPGPRRW